MHPKHRSSQHKTCDLWWPWCVLLRRNSFRSSQISQVCGQNNTFLLFLHNKNKQQWKFSADFLISLQNHHRLLLHFSTEATLICHHSTIIADMWPLKSMTFQKTGQRRTSEQMNDLHPDYRRSRHPYVTTWRSALTNRLTYVCLVTVINLGIRRWLVLVWWANTRILLVISFTVAWKRGCRCLSQIWSQLSLTTVPQREWKLKKSSEIRFWLVFPNTPTHTRPLIRLLVKSLWLRPCQ